MGRQQTRAAVFVLVGVLAASAGAATRAYFVEPKECHVGWTPEDEFVGQRFVANVDSISYIEWFVAEPSAPGNYVFEVVDEATNQVVARGQDTVPGRGWQWLRCDQFTYGSLCFTKGRDYLLKVSHSGGDSVGYVYRTDDPYAFGEMIVDGAPHTGEDLVCRVVGRMDPVDSCVWGVTSVIAPDSDGLRGEWCDSMRSSGARWGTFTQRWDLSEPKCDSAFELWDFGANVRTIHDSAGVEPVAKLEGTPKWASTRVQTYWVYVRDTTGTGATLQPVVDTSVYCAPRNLWPEDPESTNYWVRYLDTLLAHVDPIDSVCHADSVHIWSIWNESNEGCTLYVSPDSYPGYTGWWRRPNMHYDVMSDVHDMCSLYVRLCALAESTIRSHAGHETDRIVIGELGRVGFRYDPYRLVPGKEWLRTFYGIADRDTTAGRFWSVVSAHPYQTDKVPFDPAMFEADVETLRAIMRDSGDTAELWSMEFDYGSRVQITEEGNANCLGQAYTSILAQAGLPGGTYDRGCWWLFWVSACNGPWGLFDPDMTPHASYFAYRQMTHTLTGKRFNGRVLAGDTAIDPLVRMYEFEDTTTLRRLWVAWKNSTEDSGGVATRLPARSDTLIAEPLAYTSGGTAAPMEAGADGWLTMTLHNQPVFFTEAGDTSRPDLTVDSLWMEPDPPQVGQPVSLYARVWNHGSDSTGTGVPNLHPNTVVRFYANDSLVAYTDYFFNIPVDSTVTIGPAQWTPSESDTILLAAVVNGDQAFVELGLDDNAAYLKRLLEP